MGLTIYGASDDLIEVEGDVYEEFSPADPEEDTLLVVSTGHVFQVRFGDYGWSIRLLVGDPSILVWDKRGDDAEDDMVTLPVDVAWVVCDNRLEKH